MWPRSIFATWDAASPPRRALLATIGVLVALALVAFAVLGPLRAAIARGGADVTRARLMLQVARERAADNARLVRATPPPRSGDAREAVERVLARRSLQAAPMAGSTPDQGVAIVIASGRFDAVVGMIDALARDEGVELIAATLTALVDAGAVRAELTFRR